MSDGGTDRTVEGGGDAIVAGLVGDTKAVAWPQHNAMTIHTPIQNRCLLFVRSNIVVVVITSTIRQRVVRVEGTTEW